VAAASGSGRGVLRVAAAQAPRAPGVYLFLGEHREVLYVGKARDLRQRLRQHAAARSPRTRLDQKYHLVRRVVWEVAADERAALWREADLIFALRPPFNANPGLRDHDPLGRQVAPPYVVVTAETPQRLRFTVTSVLSGAGQPYGCFPHLGKGVASDLGMACSDGYTALLRLLWAASGQGTHTPAMIARSAPAEFAASVSADTRDHVHGYLSGTSRRLADHLLMSAADRPTFMQPALRRDHAAALEFLAAGPQLLRRRRLRHGVRARVLDDETYRSLVHAEILPVIDGPEEESGPEPRP
jgi:predicted GIY-YIG superfamily endonuclease